MEQRSGLLPGARLEQAPERERRRGARPRGEGGTGAGKPGLSPRSHGDHPRPIPARDASVCTSVETSAANSRLTGHAASGRRTTVMSRRLRFHLSVDGLARTRLAHSPLWEAVFSLRAVADPTASTLHEPWAVAARSRLDGIDVDTLLALWTPCAAVPDFLTPPPVSSRPQFDEELRRVRATPPEQIRRDLQVTYQDALPPGLESVYRRPGSGIDRLVRLRRRLLGARARRPLAAAPARPRGRRRLPHPRARGRRRDGRVRRPPRARRLGERRCRDRLAGGRATTTGSTSTTGGSCSCRAPSSGPSWRRCSVSPPSRRSSIRHGESARSGRPSRPSARRRSRP